MRKGMSGYLRHTDNIQKRFREKGVISKKFTPLVQKLADELGCAVYLTDSRKFFFYDPVTSAKIAKDEELMAKYEVALKTEMELFRPNVIVAFGNTAIDFLFSRIGKENINPTKPCYGELDGIKFIGLYHITGAWLKHWQRMDESITFDNLVEKLGAIITDKLPHI